MKITDIRCAGLRGATPEGGWSNELRPEDCVHTLIAVHTDTGMVGLGSVFTNDDLVRASLALLQPLYVGESALEPERVSEKLHQNMFWLGRGGSITHTISGIDIALWDLLGKATGQSVGRLLGGRYRERVQPYASLLMQEPAKMRDSLLAVKAQGFRVQNWLGTVWTQQCRHRRSDCKSSPRSHRTRLSIDGRCWWQRRLLV